MKKSVERRTGLSVKHATVAAIFVVLLLLLTQPAEAGNWWNMLLRIIPWLNNLFGPAQYGNFRPTTISYHLPNVLDASGPYVVLVFPEVVLEPQTTKRFPLIVFSHGDYGGGLLGAYYGHKALLDGLASFGFIVAAVTSCSFGCVDGDGWEKYYQEQLKLLEWASSETREEDTDGILQAVDRSKGYGLIGHSGGCTAVVHASAEFANYNVKAAVLLHPGDDPPNATYDSVVPLAAFTGTLDDCCGENTTKLYYQQKDAPPKAYANMIGAQHLEPLFFHTKWTAYAAAWFKIWIDDTDDPLYYNNLIYSDSYVSLCGGKYPMREDCEALE